jgi:hypothetical protein
MGYYCVDNLPTTLIPTFAELCAHSLRRIARIALGVDVREREYLHSVVEVPGCAVPATSPRCCFLEASWRRPGAAATGTRRRHPVSSRSLAGRHPGGRKLLANLRELADRVIDTSQITVHRAAAAWSRPDRPSRAQRQPALAGEVRRRIGRPRVRLPVPAQPSSSRSYAQDGRPAAVRHRRPTRGRIDRDFTSPPDPFSSLPEGGRRRTVVGRTGGRTAVALVRNLRVRGRQRRPVNDAPGRDRAG